MGTPQHANGDERPLFQSQRHDAITELALRHGRVDVADLAERFNVTSETIRRDLSELQTKRVLRRVHGGAVKWDALRFEPLLSVRGDQQRDEKRRIGVAAQQELPEGDTILVDSGSTTAAFCEALPTDRTLTVVTNSIVNARLLAERESINVMLLGGTLRKNTMAAVDSRTVDAVRQLTVDTLFISCDGMSIARGLSTPYEHEATLKAAMIQAARRVVVLADHTKIDNDHLYRFALWSDVDVVVTDADIDDAIARDLRRQVPALHVA